MSDKFELDLAKLQKVDGRGGKAVINYLAKTALALGRYIPTYILPQKKRMTLLPSACICLNKLVLLAFKHFFEFAGKLGFFQTGELF